MVKHGLAKAMYTPVKSSQGKVKNSLVMFGIATAYH